MYEILNKQFKTGATYVEYQGSIHRDKWPKFHWDLYPLAQEYYHELNPYFLYNLYQPELFKLVDVITVRDGFGTFADFMLKNLTVIPKLGPKLFLIHPDLAPLVPPSVVEYFACWNIVQRKQTTLSTAKKVIIFGFASDEYIGNFDHLSQRIKELATISPDAIVEIYCPIRKDIFGTNMRESFAIIHLMDQLKSVMVGRKLSFLRSDHFFEKSDFKDTYFFDLKLDNFVVTDNYLHYYVQSRGATVSHSPESTVPKESIFSLDLSIHHELHVTPLPKVDNLFTEILFYSRQNPSNIDRLLDLKFQNILREGLRK
jgi:hypothetical protein